MRAPADGVHASGDEHITPPSLAGSAWVAYLTIVRREVTRFARIWTQTLLPPVITMSLYLLIFGNLVGRRIGEMSGFDYMEYIAPGLIMMSVITNSYANVSSSFFGSRFQKFVEEMLVSPTPLPVLLAGYVTGGVARGLAVGALVTVVAAFFVDMKIHHPFIMVTMVLLTATLFSLAGFLNGLFAHSFDDVSIVPTFILAPLTYLGGVFYSVSLLPEPWSTLSLGNPILYLVNAFRYGVLGVSDIPVWFAFTMVLAFIAGLTALALTLLNRGVGIRT